MEFEVGKVYTINGSQMVYKGGPSDQRDSWENYSASAAPAAPSTASIEGDQRARFRAASPPKFDRQKTEDMFTMGQHGLLQNFSDRAAGALAAVLPGGKGYTEARDERREEIDRIREENPVASHVAEGIGAAVVPGGLFKSLGGLTAKGAKRAAIGAASAAPTGALVAAGESREGGDEMIERGLLGGAGAAALGGAVAGPGALLARKVAQGLKSIPDEGPGRILGALKEVGAEGSLDPLRKKAAEGVQQVRKTFYAPLDKQFKVVDTPEINALFGRGQEGGMFSALDETRQSVMERAGSRRMGFRDLQEVASELDKRASGAERAGRNATAHSHRNAQAELRGAMEEGIPGFSEAQTAFARAKSAEDAIDAGADAWTAAGKKGADHLRAEAAKFTTPEAQTAFRVSSVSRFFDEVSKKGKITEGYVQKLRSLGWQGRLEELFSDAESFARFNEQLSKTGEAVVEAKQIRRMRGVLLGITAFATAGWLGRRLGVIGGDSASDFSQPTQSGPGLF